MFRAFPVCFIGRVTTTLRSFTAKAYILYMYRRLYTNNARICSVATIERAYLPTYLGSCQL